MSTLQPQPRSFRSTPAIPFAEVCQLVAAVMAVRPDILAHAGDARNLEHALLRLRDGMRTHIWHVGARRLDLSAAVADYDARGRVEGLHAINDWDGVADQVNDDTIAVDVLNFIVRMRGQEPAAPATLAILLDYYLFYLAALLSLRAWDEGDPEQNLGRVDALLAELQGPGGSGQRFCDDAEAACLIATAHYEVTEHGYALLLERVRSLGQERRTRTALQHCAAMGSHLRFGFEATYARDTIKMRDDNVADYPWLCFAVAGAAEEYVRLTEAGEFGLRRDRVVEALLNGLTPDARAFVGTPFATLVPHEAERSRARELLLAHRDRLREEFEVFRPTAQFYSPLSFFFNFSHNVVKGTIVDALLRARPWPVTLTDLFTSLPRDPDVSADRTALATLLMGYARSSPQTIRGQLMPVIVYDPSTGRESFGNTMRKLME
ncbi:MAG: hypothetical protein ABI880_04035 [Acidobacteriota bacterium]